MTTRLALEELTLPADAQARLEAELALAQGRLAEVVDASNRNDPGAVAAAVKGYLAALDDLDESVGGPADRALIAIQAHRDVLLRGARHCAGASAGRHRERTRPEQQGHRAARRRRDARRRAHGRHQRTGWRRRGCRRRHRRRGSQHGRFGRWHRRAAGAGGAGGGGADNGDGEKPDPTPKVSRTPKPERTPAPTPERPDRPTPAVPDKGTQGGKP